jgi:hypothetical protein
MDKYSTADQTPDGIKAAAPADTASSHATAVTDRVNFMWVGSNKLVTGSPGVIIPVTGAASIVGIELVKAD